VLILWFDAVRELILVPFLTAVSPWTRKPKQIEVILPARGPGPLRTRGYWSTASQYFGDVIPTLAPTQFDLGRSDQAG